MPSSLRTLISTFATTLAKDGERYDSDFLKAAKSFQVH